MPGLVSLVSLVAMVDWAGWGTSIGTLALAGATFAATRSSNRAARSADRSHALRSDRSSPGSALCSSSLGQRTLVSKFSLQMVDCSR